MFEELRNEIKKAGDPEKVKVSMWFFKTEKGEYGEGDVFVGITVPVQRKIALKFKELPLKDITTLLQSKIHEERLIALFILVSQFTKGDSKKRKEIYEFYLHHTKYVNNWDLVDSSADKIVGQYLFQYCHPELVSESLPAGRSKRLEILKQVQDDSLNILTTLAKSENLWERRIAMIATFAFIKKGESELACKIADILLHDTHDLIHKAVGWMLREVGQRVSFEVEEAFLKTRYKAMPRTMLRYAIEKFPEEKRKRYLAGEI